MQNLRRCPACHLVPVLMLLPNGYWHGGCQSAQTNLCKDLQMIVLQPTLEKAELQWNALAGELIGTFLAQEAA